MYTGSEWDGHPITDDIWYVPNKFYSLSKIKAYVMDGDYVMYGFEVTFKADPTKTSGWPDEVHLFGWTGFAGYTTTYEVDLTDEITDMATCLDDIWTTEPYVDLEKIKIQ